MKKTDMYRKRLSLLLSLCMVLALVFCVLPVQHVHAASKALMVTLTDSFGDGWTGAQITVTGHTGVIALEPTNWTISSGKKAEYGIWIEDEGYYIFSWTPGPYDRECSFVFTLDGVEIYRCDDASALEEGVFFVICNHESEGGSATCTNCGQTCGEDFQHTLSDGVCSFCGAVCGMDFTHDLDGRLCRTCGAVMPALDLVLLDSYGDGWGNSRIYVYRGETRLGSYAHEDGAQTVFKIPYDPMQQYTFVLSTSNNDYEAGMRVLYQGTELYSLEKFPSYSYEETIYTTCAHSFSEGSCVCSVCGLDIHHILRGSTCGICGEELTLYTVNIADSAGGSVSSNVEQTASGMEVELTGTPAPGYLFDSYTVKDTEGNTVAQTAGCFMMPEGGATVSASFVKDTGDFVISGDDGWLLVDRVLTISEAGSYRVSMASGVTKSDHSIVVDAENVTLTLSGVNLKPRPIVVDSENDLLPGTPALTLNADTKLVLDGNVILEGGNARYIFGTDNFYSEGGPAILGNAELSGNGTLTLHGGYEYGNVDPKQAVNGTLTAVEGMYLVITAGDDASSAVSVGTYGEHIYAKISLCAHESYTDGYCAACGTVAAAKIVSGDEITYYVSITEAMTAAKEKAGAEVYALADSVEDFDVPNGIFFYGEEYTFSGNVTNDGSYIWSGTFNGTVTSQAMISGGTFNGVVNNNGLLLGGTFNGAVTNKGGILGGTFNGTVTNNGSIDNSASDDYVITLGENFTLVNNNTIDCESHFYENGVCRLCGTVCTHEGSTHTEYTDNGNGTHSFTCTACGDVTEAHAFDENGTCVCSINLFTVSDSTLTIDGTLGGKTEATEEDITVLVNKIRDCVDNGITSIIVTGSNPAMIDMGSYSATAIGEAIYCLSGSGAYDENNPYNGKIDLILSDVTEIVEWEFYAAFALNSITLPKVTTIGDEAFQGCYYLKRITFGSVVTSIVQINGTTFVVGNEVGGCDLVLNCGQLQAEYTYIPDLENNVWFQSSWGDTTWKSITLTHTLTYSASGSILSETCTCGHQATATVTAENAIYNGTEQKTATVSYSDGWMGGELTVSYENNTNAGTAAAKITLGEVTASTTFTIAPKELTLSLTSYGKEYDGTNVLTSYEANVEGFIFYDEGSYESDTLDYDDVYDDVRVDPEKLTVILPGNTVGAYTTAKVSGITLTGEDAGNYTIAAEIAEVPLEGYYGDFEISKAYITVSSVDQVVAQGNGLDQTAYTVSDLHDGFTLSGVVLQADDEDTYILVNTDNVTVTDADGNDVTDCFEIFTSSYGVITRVHEGHSFNENGFCATGECDNYQSAVLGTMTDEYGNESECYLIYNAGQLYWFARQVNEYGNNYINGKLMADITVNSDLTADDLRAWTPIGSAYPAYTGHFDGNGKTISGLYVKSEGSYVGMFGGTDYAYEIKNIHITNSYFEGDSSVGAIIGYAGSYISGCSVSDSVTVVGNSYVGGIVGSSAYGELTNCWSAATVTEGGEAGAGLVGDNHLTITNCYTTSSKLVGYNDAEIINSYYLSETQTEDGGKTAAQFAGGEVAYLLQGDQEEQIWGQTIGTDSYPTLGGKKVYQIANTGCPVHGEYGYSNEENTVFAPAHEYDKGVCACSVACPHEGEEFTCIDNGDGTHSLTYADCGYATASEKHTGGTATCTDQAVCSVCGASYGDLDPNNHTYDNGFCLCEAYEPAVLNGDVYEISNAGQLYWFIDQVKADKTVNGKLMKNITVNENVLTEMAKDTPDTSSFRTWNSNWIEYTGTFDGNGMTVSGLYFNDSSATGVGLFGRVAAGGTVQNLTVSDSYICGNVGVGGIAAYNYGTVSNCNYDGTVIGCNAVGGIAGHNEGTLENCSSEGTVTATDIGACYVGGVVGENYWPGTVKNCTNKASVTGAQFVGGVVGENRGSITLCQNEASVTGNETVGGVAGHNYTIDTSYATVTLCTNAGSVLVDPEYGNQEYAGLVGGIVGVNGNGSTVEKCRNEGSITATGEGNYNVGGIVGMNSGTVINCGNEGPASGAECVGGVVGSNGSGSVINSYNIGTVTFTTYFGGGVVGNGSTNVEGCYYLDTAATGGIGTDGTNSNDAAGQAEAKTAAQFASGEVAYLLNGSTSEGELVWKQTIGTHSSPVMDGETVYYGYTSCADNAVIGYTNDPNASAEKPDHSTTAANDKAATCTTKAYCSVCQSEYGEVSTTNHDSSVECENGFCPNGCYEPATLNAEGYYEIDNAGKLYWFAQQVNSGNSAINAILTGDIQVNEGVPAEMAKDTPDTSSFRAWTPIGHLKSNSDDVDDYVAYTGTFDGGEHTVSGLYFNDSTASYVGLFGYVGSGGTVQNVGVIDSYFYGYGYVGGVAGNNNGTVENCHNTGDVRGHSCVGGVVGYNNSNCTVSNCYNAGTVSGDSSYVGGVVGDNSGTVTGCYNTGTVSGTYDVGGVAGYNWTAVTNCYNTGSVSGKRWVGGVAGHNWTTVTNCYNTGTVSGTTDVGGVAGLNSNDTVTATVTNCYFDSTVYTGNAIGTNYDTATNVEGKSTEQFASGEVAYLLSQGEKGDIWGQTIGTNSLPVLYGETVYAVHNCKNEVTYSNTNEDLDHNYVNGTCTVCGAKQETTEFKNGLLPGNDGNYYYYADNVIQESYTGFVDNSAGSWYVMNGQVQLNTTALVTVGENQYFVKYGRLNKVNGLAKVSGQWSYFTEGKLNADYTGLVEHNGLLVYAANGHVDFNKKDIVEYEGELHYVKSGIVSPGYTGMAKGSDGVWRYISAGTFDDTYVGLAKNAVGWWYVQGGLVDTTYTGFVAYGEAQYYVSYGQVMLTTTGLVEVDGESCYVKGGAFQSSYKGLITVDTGTWYLVGGKVDFTYNGEVDAKGVIYTVVNGKATAN